MASDDSEYKFGNLHLKHAKEVSDYASKLVSDTELLITQTIPEKIFTLDKMAKEEFDSIVKDTKGVDCDLNVPTTGLRHQIDYSFEPPTNNGTSQSGKKRKHMEDGDDEAALKPYMIPSNLKIQKLIDMLKPEIKDIVETCEMIQMWIQLLIPRIEDGNNFGVSIQEEVLNEVNRIQGDCVGYLDYISRYYITRAKLVSKVAKYPFVDDYRRSVKEIDDKQFLNMKVSLNEIRNQYLLILDVVSKNYEKIKKPRNVHTGNMY